MKLHCLFFAYLCAVRFCECQEITWTWLSGSSQANSLQVDGDPGGRSGAAFWLDQNQQAVWMFGGEHHVEHDQPGLRNDLWKLDLTSLAWHQMHNGSSDSVDQVPQGRQLAAGCGVQGAYFLLYGGLGPGETVLGDMWLFYIPEGKWYKLDDLRVKMEAQNLTDGHMPSARGDMAAWCRGDFYLTIFGGFGENNILLHDMWKFDMAKLTWSETDLSSSLPADPDFVKHLWYPRGRSGAITWANYTEDKLYLFGGNIQHKNVRSKHMITGNAGDMWMYQTKADSWKYLGGTREACLQPGNYGALGITKITNHPGCRRRAASWSDTRSNLWMFGGDGVDDSLSSLSVFKHSKLLSDVWHFDTMTYNWTWKGGLTNGDGIGIYGDKGKPSNNNLPGSRCEVITWAFSNFFYMLGGVGHDSGNRDGYLNDVWQLNVALDSDVADYYVGAIPVLSLVTLGIVLMVVVFVGFMCNRNYFKDVGNGGEWRDAGDSRKGKYRRIVSETET